MMTLINRWFSQATASQDYRRGEYVVLWLVLAAGVFFRFWGLGNVGLHHDEETMAMPAMAILETGHPYLPSGMYYSRALLNIYLMSGSVWLFGESEWAFRFPSAVVGSLTALVAFFMGRRFLAPQFNLAFVATVGLLPAMIEISQTARMYVFFVTCVIWFGACLFRWERDQKISSLLLALLVWLLGLHFHTLAIFAAPLFLFPGLSRRSWSQFFQGAGAFLVGGVVFSVYSRWITEHYPDEEERPEVVTGVEDSTQAAVDVFLSGNKWIAIGMLAAIAVFAVVVLATIVKRRISSRSMPALVVVMALLAMAALQYHIGGILLLFGIAFWLREPELRRSHLIGALLLAVVMSAIHLTVLHDTGLYPGRKLLGAIVGTPSVWPILRFLEYSVVAGAIYIAVLGFALFRFALGRTLPIHVLFFVMGVWAPLLLLGYFAWHMPPRYTIGQLGYFLMCTFAGLAFIANDRRWISNDRLSLPKLGLLSILAIMMINPVELARAVNPDYSRWPDHKGAADYIKSLELDADTILIAEDILQQTYYLKDVDYYLREIDRAQHYAVVRNGHLVDQYTGAKVLGTGRELKAVLDGSGGREVYIIGSGENFVDGKRNFRGRGISDVLESERLEVVYHGRDGKTKVWKLVQ